MRRLPVLILAFLSLSLAACGDDDGGGTPPPAGCDAFVAPGGEVQTAVQEMLIMASTGDVLCLDGRYAFTDELSLEVDGVTIRGSGAERAVLDFTGQTAGANGLHVQSVAGITLENLEVSETAGDAVRFDDCTDVVVRDVEVRWIEPGVENGAYGLYPVGCTNVLLEDSEVYGASDAGFYVGQSRNIVVRNNLSHGNVAGIEIENSLDAEVYGNEATDNTGGILAFDLPGLSMQGGGVLVHDNMVHDNNRENFAAIGTIVGYLPTGTGMMLLAMDRVEIRNNTVTGNEGTGLLAISYKVVEGVGAGGMVPAEYDAYGETNYIHDNTFSDNGTVPRDLLIEVGPPPLSDLLWDGVMDPTKDNTDGHLSLCIRNNGAATFTNFQLDPDMGFAFGDPLTDLAPHDCEHMAVPPVVLP